MTPTLHIHLLGDFLVVSGETPVTTVHVPRLQSLLAYLVLHRTAPQNRSHLAFLLWPDSTDAQAHANLRKALYHLRRALPSLDHYLQIDRQSLHWQPSRPDASWTLDVLDVEQALTSAMQAEQEHDTTALRQALERTVDLYRGDLLPSCYDEWILPERDRVRQLFFQAAEQLITLLEQECDYDTAIETAQRLLRHDPLQERSYRSLMCLYALRGDRAAALRVYHTCVTTLERELAAEPSDATRQAYESLLQLETSSQSRTGSFSPRGTGTPLVGRKYELSQLQTTWRLAASGHLHMVVLTGEAGIGKTRLAEEMVAWVSWQGMSTVIARCYAAEGRLAYAPVAAWFRADVVQTGLSALDNVRLSEVARLVPDILTRHPGVPRPASMTEGWQRQHFFEALARALLVFRQPLLLLLDDLQWCDDETLEWVHYLLRFEPKARLLLIGTVRSEETLPRHPLGVFLGALQHDGLVTEIALRPLTMTETTSLAEHVAGKQLDPALISMLHRETEGNPLFVVEMVRAGTLEQGGSTQQTADSSLLLLTQPASMLPPTVQNVLSTRLAQLSPLAREVANVAAVIGREFPFAVLARASGESEEAVVRGLDELWQRRMVREQGAGTTETYDFSHDKLREQAYASLSPAHQRLLHRRVAEAFEVAYAEDLDAVSRQIAVHYERAGLPGKAIPYYRRAGEVAMRIYANAEAITAFQQAITLLETNLRGRVRQEQQWQEAVLLHENLGDVLEMTGRFQEAKQAYQRAMTYVPTQEYIWQARLQRKTARSWQFASGNPHDAFHVNARQAFQEAERILGQASVKSSSEWLREWISLHLDQLFPLRTSAEEMTAVIEKAQPIVEQHGTVEQRGHFLLAMVVRDIARDRYVISETTVAYCREALAAIQQTGSKSTLGFAHLALGNCLLWSDHLDEAEKHMRAAMDIGEQVGNATLLVRCLTFLPFIFRRRGQVEQVRSLINRSLAMPEGRNISLITGHRAWIEWHDGNMVEAGIYGRASLEDEQRQQQINPFHWTGLWPLIGVALAQEKVAEAIHYVCMLLEPTQQPPPELLRTLLEMTVHTCDAGEQEEARSLLRQAVPLAEKSGYL